MSHSASMLSLVEIVNADNLPSPPTVATEILRLTRDEGVSLSDLSAVISRDPALAAKLLKLSNSSLFPSGAEVRSLDQAMVRLGIKTVKLMALSFSLVNGLDADSEGAFDFGAFWRRSVGQAVAGRAFARLCGSSLGEEAFLCGILSRIGQLALLQVETARYAEVIAASPNPLPSAAEERAVFGLDHHQIGAALLEKWQLPAAITVAVGSSGTPETAAAVEDPESAQLALVVHVARQAMRVIFDDDKGTALAALHEGAQAAGFDPDQMDGFLVELENDVSEAAALLDVDLGETRSYDLILQDARAEMVRISLGTALDLEATRTRADRLELKANTDSMTGLPNRACFEQRVADEIRRAREAADGRKTGLLVLDVDKFKTFNDTHGHLVGDEVLKVVASVLGASVSEPAMAARYGGEEFVVVVPAADQNGLKTLAEKIRLAIEATRVEAEGKSLSVTVSIGGAAAPVATTEEAKSLLKVADEFLYAAKESGRNRTVCREVPGAALI